MSDLQPLYDQVDQLCQDRIERNARIKELMAFVTAYDDWQTAKRGADVTGNWIAIAPVYDRMLAARAALEKEGA